MKRSLPFIIIASVGLLAIGGGYFFYRFKMQPITPAATPVPAAVANTSAAGNPTTSAATDSSVAPTVPPLLAKRDDDTAKHIRGSATAPVTLEIYGDFQCPSCAHTAMVIKELEAQYGDRLREIFYEFPLAMHNHSVEAARAAEAAGLQGRFWPMHDQLYQYQDVWSKVSNVSFFFETYAKAIGLDVARFKADYQSPDVQQRVISQGEGGVARGVRNTPTIFINGTQIRSEFTKEKIQKAIDNALAAKGNS